MIQIPQKDSKLYIDKFYELYPQVKIFLNEIIKKAEEN
jgi:DNA polymerase-1